jgi:hypothetical protein
MGGQVYARETLKLFAGGTVPGRRLPTRMCNKGRWEGGEGERENSALLQTVTQTVPDLPIIPVK